MKFHKMKKIKILVIVLFLSNNINAQDKNAQELNLAFTKDSLGDYKTAIDIYTRAISQNPKNIDLYYYRANSFFSKKDYDSAINDYDVVLKLKPDFKDALYNKANSYYELKKFHEAIPIFDKILAVPNRGRLLCFY